MHLKTICGLICAIIFIFINRNDAAPTAKGESAPSSKGEAAPAAKPDEKKVNPVPIPRLVGAREDWSKNIGPKAKKLFNDYKKHINKKLHETHKLPGNFVPKPDKHAKQLTSFYHHHFLVKVPGRKYAYVIVNENLRDTANYGKPDNVRVQPKLYGLHDKNI